MSVKDLQEKKAVENTTVGEMQASLDRLERTTGSSGAVPLTPKAQLLDAREVESNHKDKRLRWVNVQNAEKAQLRQAQGYERVPVAEGGRQVGNLALFALPREEFVRREAAVERQNKDRLSAHKSEVERMAESVARELRDRHGISVSTEKILYSE